MSHAQGAASAALGGCKIVIKEHLNIDRYREKVSMAQFQTRPSRGLDKVDPVWARIRSEAEDVTRHEPELATFIYENILHRDTLEAAIAHRVSQRLPHGDVSAGRFRQAPDDPRKD